MKNSIHTQNKPIVHIAVNPNIVNPSVTSYPIIVKSSVTTYPTIGKMGISAPKKQISQNSGRFPVTPIANPYVKLTVDDFTRKGKNGYPKTPGLYLRGICDSPSVKINPKIKITGNSDEEICGGTTIKLSNLKQRSRIELLTLTELIIDTIEDLLEEGITLHNIIKAGICIISTKNAITISLTKKEVIVLYALSDTYNTTPGNYVSFEKALLRANCYCSNHGEKHFSEKEFSNILKHLDKLECIKFTDAGLYLCESIQMKQKYNKSRLGSHHFRFNGRL